MQPKDYGVLTMGSASKPSWISDAVAVTDIAFVANSEFNDTVLTADADGSFMLWSMDNDTKPIRTAQDPHARHCACKAVEEHIRTRRGVAQNHNKKVKPLRCDTGRKTHPPFEIQHLFPQAAMIQSNKPVDLRKKVQTGRYLFEDQQQAGPWKA